MKGLFVPLPPFFEQRQIVEYLSVVLDQHEALTGCAEKAIALLRERRSALIAAAVTGKIDVRNLANMPA